MPASTLTPGRIVRIKQDVRIYGGERGHILTFRDFTQDAGTRARVNEFAVKIKNQTLWFRPDELIATSGVTKVRSAQADDSLSLAAQIRLWGRENGFEVADRGRFGGELVDAFSAANPGAVTAKDRETLVFGGFRPKGARKASEQAQAPATEASLIRAWGVSHGFQVGARGRLAPDLVAAYRKAMRAAPTKITRK